MNWQTDLALWYRFVFLSDMRMQNNIRPSATQWRLSEEDAKRYPPRLLTEEEFIVIATLTAIHEKKSVINSSGWEAYYGSGTFIET